MNPPNPARASWEGVIGLSLDGSRLRLNGVGKPRLLWEGHYNEGLNSMCGAPGPTSSNYDVTADGQRFLMIEEGGRDKPATEIRVVLNWVEELKRLTAPKGRS